MHEVKTNNVEQNNRIEWLEINMELMKQDRLKNNICISGVPVDITNNRNISDIVSSIGNKLGYEVNSSLFMSTTLNISKNLLTRYG